MYPVLFQLGHFELRSYGVLVVLSFFTGLWLISKEAERKGMLLKVEVFMDREEQGERIASVSSRRGGTPIDTIVTIIQIKTKPTSRVR